MFQNYSVIFLISLMIFSSAHAESFKPFLGEANGCTVETFTKDKELQTQLKCSDVTHTESSEFLNNRFLRWATIKNTTDTYVLIFLTKGAHGEKVVIFSKKNKKVIQEIASSWPIEIKTEENQVKLDYKLDSDEEGNFQSNYYIFQ